VGLVMGTISIVEYAWYIPGRVYIIRMEGTVTVNLMERALSHVLGVLDETDDMHKVHLIYDIESVHLSPDVPLPYILGVTAELYRHPNTASMVSIIGLNRLHAFLANEAGKAYTRNTQQGQAVGTMNDALRFVAFIDSSLPIENI
jgi:hypothetical protein